MLRMCECTSRNISKVFYATRALFSVPIHATSHHSFAEVHTPEGAYLYGPTPSLSEYIYQTPPPQSSPKQSRRAPPSAPCRDASYWGLAPSIRSSIFFSMSSQAA